jgi:hypothetical protein
MPQEAKNRLSHRKKWFTDHVDVDRSVLELERGGLSGAFFTHVCELFVAKTFDPVTF